jgi:hypothetical protein
MGPGVGHREDRMIVLARTGVARCVRFTLCAAQTADEGEP